MFEIIQLTSKIGSLLGSENNEEYNHKEHAEGLDPGAKCLEEDRDEYHGYLAIHDDTLPVVSARTVALEEESILALYFVVLELIFPFLEQKPSAQRDASHPEQQAWDTS